MVQELTYIYIRNKNDYGICLQYHHCIILLLLISTIEIILFSVSLFYVSIDKTCVFCDICFWSFFYRNILKCT